MMMAFTKPECTNHYEFIVWLEMWWALYIAPKWWNGFITILIIVLFCMDEREDKLFTKCSLTPLTCHNFQWFYRFDSLYGWVYWLSKVSWGSYDVQGASAFTILSQWIMENFAHRCLTITKNVSLSATFLFLQFWTNLDFRQTVSQLFLLEQWQKNY